MSFLNSLRYGLTSLAGALDVWILKNLFSVGFIDGINVCDMTESNPSKSIFLKPTSEALNLIRIADARRYRRVRQQLKYIVNRPLISAGTYQAQGQVCNVDYTKHYSSENAEWSLRMYACLLIHEATHGLLLEKGISYSKQTRERSERLCGLEEYRFMQRIDAGWADEYLSPEKFNSAWLEVYWEDRCWHQRAWSRRIKEWFEQGRKERKLEARERKMESLRKKGRRLF